MKLYFTQTGAINYKSYHPLVKKKKGKEKKILNSFHDKANIFEVRKLFVISEKQFEKIRWKQFFLLCSLIFSKIPFYTNT